VNSQHSLETEEVLIVHTGRWRFMCGPNADDDSITLGEGDVISVPIHMFRRFESTGPGAPGRGIAFQEVDCSRVPLSHERGPTFSRCVGWATEPLGRVRIPYMGLELHVTSCPG
jgi:hypothetical protein